MQVPDDAIPHENLTFALTRIKAHGSTFKPALDAITANACQTLDPASSWGIFSGIFGIGSNELAVVTTGNVSTVTGDIRALESVATAETLVLEPTIQPH